MIITSLNKNKSYEYYSNDKVFPVYWNDRTKKSFSLIKNYNSKRVLDVGCGDGSFSLKIQNFTKNIVYGIDVSETAVKLSIKKGINAIKCNINYERLPFKDEFFDIIFMGEVIEHLSNPDFAIKEIRRVLKDKGVLILSTPNLACWYNRLLLALGIQPIFSEVSTKKIFGRPGSQPVGHLRLFTLSTLKEFLKFYGFEVKKIKGATFESLPSWMIELDKLLSVYPQVSSILIVKAIKLDK